MTRHGWHPALVLVLLAGLLASLLAQARFPGWGWEQAPTARGLPRNLGAAYRETSLNLVDPNQHDLLRTGCYGGSHQYCGYTVFRVGKDGSLAASLNLDGSCDVLFPPRMWLSPAELGYPRQILTYHETLPSGRYETPLEGGYWLWTWDGQRYRPSRP